MTDTSGPTSTEPFARYDPDSSSWRTSKGTSGSASEPYSGIWPAAGTTLAGSAYARPTWERATDAPGFSSSPGTGLPTPTARDWRGRNLKEGYLPNALWDADQNLTVRTPREQETPSTADKADPDNDEASPVKLLPTPLASDWKGNRRYTGSYLPNAFLDATGVARSTAVPWPFR